MQTLSTDRIQRIRKRYQAQTPRISIQRAGFFTQSWKQTSGTGAPLPIRVALAMKNVYEKMTHYIDPGDHIAGAWTEFFMGMPIDIERGLFNRVLETELDRMPMILFKLQSSLNGIRFMIENGTVPEFFGDIKYMRDMPIPVDLKFQTMPRRDVNPFDIDPGDKKILLDKLLPWWKGKTVAEHIETAFEQSGLFSKNELSLRKAVTVTPTRQVMILTPAATICVYQGHTIPDLESALKKGLEGMKQEVESMIAASPNLPREQMDFLESIKISLEGFMIFARRLAEQIEKEFEAETHKDRKSELKTMLDICRKVPLHPAETFREAVQSLWTVRTALSLAHPANVHALGRLDQIFYPYYMQDIRTGAITRDQARELLEELLLKIMSQNMRPESNVLGAFYHRFEGSEPVTLGGLTPDGKDATNELTYVFLDAVERSRSIINVVVRVHKQTPEKLYLAVAEKFYNGASNLSMMNDDIHVEGLKRRGYPVEDARNYALTGCTDVIVPGKTGGLSVSGLMLAKILDMTLRNGDIKTPIGTLRGLGPRTGEPDTFASFDQFKDAFIAQAGFAMKKIAAASDLRDRVFAETIPAPCLSAFVQGCLENKRDVTRGGAVYDSSLVNMINSIANVVDSMFVIRKLIFEEKRLTFKELLEAVDRNFLGHEELHRDILGIEGKWGNGNPESDALARELTTRLFELTYKYRSFRSGPWVPVINSMTSHTIDGRISIATPDGRLAATPYAASCNPCNVERSGITGVLKSVAAIDFTHVLSCAVNIKLHPSAIGKTEAARKKWISLIRTYFALGGAQIQPTVASAEVLRAAQNNPGEYSDLIVKVGGYSVYFVELGREIQDEVIARSEHCSCGSV